MTSSDMNLPTEATHAPIGPDNDAASAGLADWMRSQGVALAVSTYRANRLIFVGVGDPAQDSSQLLMDECPFDRPMGMAVHGNSLWVVGRYQLWRLDNWLEAGQTHDGADRLYVPATGHTTGDVNGHEVVIAPDGAPVFVNTAFSCLATIQPGSSFTPIWQPPFITGLTADDRCHLNGMATLDGQPTWATACGTSDSPTGWRGQRSHGGVLMHIPTQRTVATGLSMPHSPRWHQGRLWLLNSGTGELGWIEDQQFVPLCFVPGFVRGLVFVGNTAVVGLSKLRSPQFTGLALEQKLQAMGLPVGCCGLRVIDLSGGTVLHSLDLPEPVDEIFDLVALPGVRRARALSLQDEAIHCLVKLPEQAQLVTVRPKAPSGQPFQAEVPPIWGMGGNTLGLDGSGLAQKPPVSVSGPAHAAPHKSAAIRYQRVFQFTPQTLLPYVSLTFPALTPDSPRLAALTGELFATSAMADGTMVGLAMAERTSATQASLISLMVEPAFRHQGIGTRLLFQLQRFLALEGVQDMVALYQSDAHTDPHFEPLLQRLGWSAPVRASDPTQRELNQNHADHLSVADGHTRSSHLHLSAPAQG